MTLAGNPIRVRSADTPGGMDLAASPNLKNLKNLKDAMESLRDPEAIFEHGLQALVVGFRAGLEAQGQVQAWTRTCSPSPSGSSKWAR
ncbi:hypothetical protein ACEZDB_10175 [Streptacidiphilus sp. N1-3]|uniref:Uncharacterized protein n=1 Tax=Streptacidiphilus alkalitolerans TaxID=3342712 RepID=A0ABV6WZ83_9ACTN